MKKLIAAALLSAALTACAQSTRESPPFIGGQKDAHGCLPSAGQSYSFIKRQCVQVFDIADIRLTDPANNTLAAYGILSADKQQAEVFAADLPENTILDVVNGGYASKDGKVRLIKKKKKNSWKIYK